MSASLRVLFLDNHLLVLDKPAGIPTVPDASGDTSLFDLAREHVRAEFSKPGRVFLGAVQRLDRPVSGVIVFARTSKAASRLVAAQREGRFTKTYLAIGEGRPRGREGVVEQWLGKDERRNRVLVLDGERPEARRALTHWRVLAQEGERTLYELAPRTGRAHQLRVACASLGTPLLGDLKYGASKALPDRSVALHALRIVLSHPTRGTELAFQAPPPAGQAWGILRAAGP